MSVILIAQAAHFDSHIKSEVNIILLIMTQLQKQLIKNPVTLQLINRRDTRQLTNTAKNLYVSFSSFQLEMSRLTKIPHFIQLISELKAFNQQLDKWKKDEHDIKNIIVTYHLYQNLFSRLRFITNLSRNHQQSVSAIQKATEWFYSEKPKIRGQAKEVHASMKNLITEDKQQHGIERMVQNNAIKRQLQPYELMSRTAHPGLFPPKQQLKYYKRKQFLPFTTDENPMSAKKSTSASMLSKNRLSKFRMSVGTMMTSASMKQTKDHFRYTVSQFKIQNVKQKKKSESNNQKLNTKQNEKQNQILQQGDEQKKILDEELDEIQRQKKVEQQQIIQDNIAPNIGEEDGADEQNIYQQQKEEPKQGARLYMKDYDPQEEDYAKQLIKQQQQSTLRRVMKVNEDKIRSKLEELDLKRNMMNWGKIKGRNHKEESRKLEGKLHVNRFNQIAYKNKNQSLTQGLDFQRNNKVMSSTTGFNQVNNTKEPTVVPMLYRSKSSYPGSMQNDIQKLKIKETFRTYGKYINHLPLQQINDGTPEQSQTRKTNDDKCTPQIRSMSLTNLSSFKKKQGFSSLLQTHNPYSYNEQVQDQILRIKTSLSKKGAPMEKGTIYKALSAIPAQQIHPSVGFYTSGRDLLSNPFFPKHLFNAKKKKKKSK